MTRHEEDIGPQERVDLYADARNTDYERHIRERGYQRYDGVSVLAIVPHSRQYTGGVADTIFTESNEAHAEHVLLGQTSYDRGMIVVPLYRGNDPARGWTLAAAVGLTLIEAVEDYPLLDEVDYCQREHDAREEAISDAIRWTLGIFDDEDQERITAELDDRICQGTSAIYDYGVDDTQWTAEQELTEIATALGYDLDTGERTRAHDTTDNDNEENDR